MGRLLDAGEELYSTPEPPPWATAVVWSGTFATLLAMAMTLGFVFSGLRHTPDAARADTDLADEQGRALVIPVTRAGC